MYCLHSLTSLVSKNQSGFCDGFVSKRFPGSADGTMQHPGSHGCPDPGVHEVHGFHGFPPKTLFQKNGSPKKWFSKKSVFPNNCFSKKRFSKNTVFQKNGFPPKTAFQQKRFSPKPGFQQK